MFRCIPAAVAALLAADRLRAAVGADRWSTSTSSTATPANGCPNTAHRGETWVAGTPGHRYARAPDQHHRRARAGGAVGRRRQRRHRPDRASVAGRLRAGALAEHRDRRLAQVADDIAQFVFTDLPDSYAARTGRPRQRRRDRRRGVPRTRPHPRYYPTPAPPIARERRRARRSQVRARRPPPAAARIVAAADSAVWRRRAAAHRHRPRRSANGRRSVSTDFVRATPQAGAGHAVALRRCPIAWSRSACCRDRYPHWRSPRRARAFPDGFVADPPPRW